VTALVSDTGAPLARYRYSPFGERLESTGPLADLNPYQFSSKPREAVGGVYYYGYRFYDPVAGRWPNRDPLGEVGGLNFYGYVGNNPVNAIDPLGLAFLDYVPIVGTIRSCFGKNPGDNPNDYAGVGKLSCEDCKFDKDYAEALCQRRVDVRAASNVGSLVAPGVVKFGVDVITAGLGILGGPPGWIISGVAAVDGVAGAACTIQSSDNIRKAADKAKEQQCRCP
jgi:RHS repeat-associated protein